MRDTPLHQRDQIQLWLRLVRLVNEGRFESAHRALSDARVLFSNLDLSWSQMILIPNLGHEWQAFYLSLTICAIQMTHGG